MNLKGQKVERILLLFCSISIVSMRMIDAQTTKSMMNNTNTLVNNSTVTAATQPIMYTYYSSVNYNTYSCWTERPDYGSGYWLYTSWPNIVTGSYYSYYYYTSSLVTYTQYSYAYAYTRLWRNLTQYLTTCDNINKTSIMPYQCPYAYSSFGSLCSQQYRFDNGEFYRSFSNDTYCKYHPQYFHQCGTLRGTVGTWNFNQSSQWSFYLSDLTTCSWVAMYQKDNCYSRSNDSNVFEATVTCSMYSAQNTSVCAPQHVYTSAYVSSGPMSYFYTYGSSCLTYYQSYISCYSCGYEPSYNWNYYYYYWYQQLATYVYNCSMFYSGSAFNAYNVIKNEVINTHLVGPYVSTLITNTYVNNYYGMYPSENAQYISYYPNSLKATYQETADYNCYLSWVGYSWYEYYNGISYGKTSMWSYVVCDPYHYTRSNVTYTSCDAYITPMSSCYITTGYSYTNYGLIAFSQYQSYRYCPTTWTLNQSCYDCKSDDTPFTSWYYESYGSYGSNTFGLYNPSNFSCVPRQISSFSYYSYNCTTYSSNYLSCTDMGNTTSLPSYYYSGNSSMFISSGPWERSWFCREGGKYYTLCNNCKYYRSYFYNIASGYYPGYSFTSSCAALDSPPSPCYPEFCLNNGNCVTSGCPSGYATCCNCPADFLGERCELNRTFVIQSTLRRSDAFLPGLLDPSTELFKNFSATFTEIWYNVTVTALRQTYGDVNVVNVQVTVTRFKPGSIIAVIITHGATYHGKPVAITEKQLKKVLEAHCESSRTCKDFNLDKTHLTFNATPNVCEESAMHACSPYATCDFHGGVDYTCKCLPGYRDDAILFGRSGSLCTETCYDHTCHNGGSCKEYMNSEIQCLCRSGYSGKYCEVNLGGRNYSLALLAMIIIGLLLIVIYLVIKLHKLQYANSGAKGEPLKHEPATA